MLREQLASLAPSGNLSGMRELVWSEYTPPPDAFEWLFSIIDAAETMPTPITICDMRTAGNPMVYVNQAFCRCTGYRKADVQGKNCRILQGANTEVAAVATIVDALRRGSDCTVKMTNYKRSGDTFDNLLSIRPVHDSNGVYRFCVAVQGDATAGQGARELQKALLHLLPRHLRLARSTPPCGPYHKREPEPSNLNAHIDEWIQEAMEEPLEHPEGAEDIKSAVRFEGNHNIMLASMVAAADRTPLIALYWSCPACAKGLEAAFAEPAVHQYLNSRVSALERALGYKGALMAGRKMCTSTTDTFAANAAACKAKEPVANGALSGQQAEDCWI